MMITQAVRAVRRILEQSRQRRMLARLDARTLRDIGLSAHAEEQQRRARMRATAFRIGLY
jgi:uncharacterized protein YjiS (DUF1127 family)